MAFPKQVARVLDGKPDSVTVNNETEERAARMKGYTADADGDGLPDAAPEPKEFPKMLHGNDANGNAMTKIVHSTEEEAAAVDAGWKLEPKQDHGPVDPAPVPAP